VHRCPECGRAFDPKKRWSFVSNADLQNNKDDRHFWIAVAIVALLACVILVVAGGAAVYYILRKWPLLTC
jgi:hypothetical protein